MIVVVVGWLITGISRLIESDAAEAVGKGCSVESKNKSMCRRVVESKRETWVRLK